MASKSLADLFREDLEGEAADTDTTYITPSVARDVATGVLFVAGTGRLTIAAAGNYRLTFGNPAGSGKNLSIIRLALMPTVTSFTDFRLNPNAGLPATAARKNNPGILGSNFTSVAVVKADTSTLTALSGGTDMEVTLGLPANQRTSIDLPPLIVPPGVTLGMNIAVTAASDLAASIYWKETSA